MISGTKTNTVVTAIYKLGYIPERNAGGYKSFPLLTETLRAQIFDKYNYIIYTNKETYTEYGLEEYFNLPNVTIKFKELNQSLYTEIIKPVKDAGILSGEVWERLYSVDNYIEVVLNKLEVLLEESKIGTSGNIIWLDAGLFGTSCHDGWRDYMRTELVYNKTLFLDKVFESIDRYGFIATKGNNIQVNYEVNARLTNLAGSSVNLIPGCIFGGTKENTLRVLEDYKNVFLSYLTQYNHLISEQELLAILTVGKDVKFFEFDDWTDLQKAFLKIMDKYDEVSYKTEKCYDY